MMRAGKFLRTAAIGAGLAIGVSSVALAGPVEDRQAAMKAIGQSMKDGAALARPDTFDAAKAKAAMGGVAASAKKAATLFPAGSGADPKTNAKPDVWANSADFSKRLADLAALATTASNAADAATYAPAFKAVGATCKSCHDVYRKDTPN